MKWRSVVLVSVFSLAGPVGSTEAAMLDKEICDGFKSEQERLGGKRLRDAMEKGPEWAKVNLPAAGMDDVRRYIELEEQVLFRCPRPKPVKPAKPAAATVDAEGEEKPVRKAVPKASAKAMPATETAPAAEAKPKPKAKPKANDAYVPAAKKPAEG